MKRAGFTMIELIFVIVILGILAAVALPKFIGVAEQATAGKLNAYVGTLNRTVGPSLWADSISGGTNGSVQAYTDAQMRAQIETPDVGDTGTKLDVPDLSSVTNWAAATLSDPATDTELIGLAEIATATIGATVYRIKAIDGSMSEAPRFVLTKDPADANESVVR